jgi:RNA polymerase sigma factor (sigma-70 family)
MSSPHPTNPSRPNFPEEHLFRTWRAGDARAGDMLFRCLRARLLRFFRGCDPHLVDDLVQETLVACVYARHTLRHERALLSYLYTVARRALMRQYKALPLVELDEEATSAGAMRDEPDRLIEARRLLMARPSPCTHIVALRLLEGCRGVEIARALQISEASVRRKLQRGLAELRASASLPTRP